MNHIYREFFPLQQSTPGKIRSRIGSFAPLLESATDAMKMAASEMTAAFLRYGRADGFVFRLFAGDEAFRVEMIDSLLTEQQLSSPQDQEGLLRLSILNAATDRWGILGNGVSVVWFEVLRAGRAVAVWAREGEA